PEGAESQCNGRVSQTARGLRVRRLGLNSGQRQGPSWPAMCLTAVPGSAKRGFGLHLQTVRDAGNMKNKKLKFGIGIGIILGVVGWEAVSGFQQSKTYYVTVSELLSGKAARRHARVGGVVQANSIARLGEARTFRLATDASVLRVACFVSCTLP